MCGVVAVLAPFASPSYRFDLLTRLLQESTIRGADATGVAFTHPETGKLVVVKDGESATTFTKTPEFRALEGILPPVVIGHTRASSRGWNKNPQGVGNPFNNQNNHPFFSQATGLAIVHNGLVEDDPWRRTVGKPNGILNSFDGGTDSELFLRMIETVQTRFQKSHNLSMLQVLDNVAFNVAGQYVVLVVSEHAPNKVWMMRHSKDDRPLALAYLPNESVVVMASTRDILEEALKEREYFLDFFWRDVLPDDVCINTLGDDFAAEITLLQDDPFFKFTSLPITAADDNYSYHTKFLEEKRKAETETDEEDVEIVSNEDDAETVIVD